VKAAASGEVYIGASGWQYPHWREIFYPGGLGTGDWLSWYAKRFQTVEINNTFYRLPERTTFEHWKGQAPADFVFSVKMSRYLTHVKRLREPEEPVKRFLSRAEGLGNRLGPVLIQLPPNLPVELERLDETLGRFPAKVKIAVEFRHQSWLTDETFKLLQKRKAAFCLADSPERKTTMWRTADWGFVRFHAGLGQPFPCYDKRSLKGWAGQIAEFWPHPQKVYVYFNNDAHGCALRDASVFAQEAADAGLHPTSTPPPIPYLSL
jgi:uncharacterized protein YecE (DUF72 family)